MNGLPYYKRYPRDFIEGTLNLPFEIKAGYGLLLDLIYMQGGDLPDDDRYISGLLNVSVRKWKSIRQTLISLGKISASEGVIRNKRAIIELETLSSFGDKQSENAGKSRKFKGLRQPKPSQSETETETEPIEKPCGFSARETRKKPKGWVSPKTPIDAANNIIRRIRANEQQRIGAGDVGPDGTVLQLPAVGRSGA